MQPEELFKITITDTSVKAEHPERKIEEIRWDAIRVIKLINTDQGPWLPDVWLALLGDESGCLIPQGAEEFDAVYEIVSKYPGFNFENVIASMQCTENDEFLLWAKDPD